MEKRNKEVLTRRREFLVRTLQGTGLQNAIDGNTARIAGLEQRILEWTQALTI